MSSARELTENAVLSMLRGLCDAVTPQLRAVTVDIDPSIDTFYTQFFYDGEASEDLLDLWECAITEASAGASMTYEESSIDRWDYPKKIPVKGRLVYLRNEPTDQAGVSNLEKGRFLGREYITLNKNSSKFIDPSVLRAHSTDRGIIHKTDRGNYVVPGRSSDYSIGEQPLIYARLSMQKALLGKITPELRSVVIDVAKEKPFLYAHLYHDKHATQEMIGLWEYALSEVIADMGPEYEVDVGIHRLDPPEEPSVSGWYVYIRKENNNSTLE